MGKTAPAENCCFTKEICKQAGVKNAISISSEKAIGADDRMGSPSCKGEQSIRSSFYLWVCTPDAVSQWAVRKAFHIIIIKAKCSRNWQRAAVVHEKALAFPLKFAHKVRDAVYHR